MTGEREIRDAVDDLGDWIAALRSRDACGDLAGLGRVELDGGILLPAMRAARILLADLDHLDDLARALRGDLSVVARQQAMLRNLDRLRK